MEQNMIRILYYAGISKTTNLDCGRKTCIIHSIILSVFIIFKVEENNLLGGTDSTGFVRAVYAVLLFTEKIMCRSMWPSVWVIEKMYMQAIAGV